MRPIDFKGLYFSIISIFAMFKIKVISVLGHTERPDLGFNLLHKVHVYNLVM